MAGDKLSNTIMGIVVAIFLWSKGFVIFMIGNSWMDSEAEYETIVICVLNSCHK